MPEVWSSVKHLAGAFFVLGFSAPLSATTPGHGLLQEMLGGVDRNFPKAKRGGGNWLRAVLGVEFVYLSREGRVACAITIDSGYLLFSCTALVRTIHPYSA